jgi:DNA repair exonuclease SbcCD ATPase subunit
MAPNPERAIALSFRQMDYLGCGLPVLMGADQPLSDDLERSGAGVVGLGVEEAVDLVLEELEGGAGRWLERCEAARALARSHFHYAICGAPLVEWLQAPTLREKRPRPLGELARALAELAEARAERRAMAERLQSAEAEVQAKRAEVEALAAQIRGLLGTVDQLSGAVAEVAGFKREAIAVLGTADEASRRALRDVERELSIARADLAKKSAEIEGMEGERRRLENDLVHVRDENARLRRRGLFRG